MAPDLLAWGDSRADHLPCLESLNRLLFRQVNAREALLVQRDTLVGAALGCPDRQRQPLPAHYCFDRADACGLKGMRL
jgi:hypothetical protein